MKRLLLTLGLLLFTSPAWATWAKVQAAHNTSCTAGSTTCAITVSSTGSGHLLVFYAGVVGGATNNFTITAAATGAGTMVLCPTSSCHVQFASVNGNLDMGYILSSSSGATTLTVTRNTSSTNAWWAFVAEYSYGGTASIDTEGTRTATSCASPCAGIALTLGGSDDMIAQAAQGAPNTTAVASPYSAQADITVGLGFAQSINTASGTAASWTDSATGNMMFGAVAFTETGATTSVDGSNGGFVF